MDLRSNLTARTLSSEQIGRLQVLNESLKILRLYLGLTQSQLAKDLGISQSYVSEIERGEKDVTLDLLQKYSDKLEVPLSSLIFFAENLDGVPPKSQRRIFIAEKVLKLLKHMAPGDAEENKN